jgi:hypothetical protein
MSEVVMGDQTLAEMLAELERHDAKSVTGITADEMVRATGRTARWVGEQIRRAVADGRMVFVGKREGVGVDGRRKLTPVYARAAGASQRSMATSTGGRTSTPTAKRTASRRASSGVRLPHVTR